MSENGKVNIRGKEYNTVALRVHEFRKDHPGRSIRTELVELTAEKVVIKASISEGELVLADGHAEENRNSSSINRTSALENCETSAVGRALAFLGYGGTQIASADEVQQAIHQQTQGKQQPPAELTTDSVLPKGDHKGTRLIDCPAEYLERMAGGDHEWAAPAKRALAIINARAAGFSEEDAA